MGTPQAYGSESTAPVANKEMYETHDTSGTQPFKESMNQNGNHTGSNTLSVDEIMGSQDTTSFPPGTEAHNTRMNTMVKNYNISSEATKPDKKRAAQGLKMYIGKNQTINMSRHKQV